MYKVGICGRFGYNSGSVNGQTDKTVAVYNAVAKAIGKENIALIDDFSYPPEVEEKIDEPEKTTHLLKKINLLDKAASFLKIKI